MRPSGQFFVEDVCSSSEMPDGLVPVDNFLWKTKRGEVIRLVMSSGEVFVINGNRSYKVVDVPDGLRTMAHILERKARGKH